MKCKILKSSVIGVCVLAGRVALGSNTAPTTQPTPRVEIFQFTSIANVSDGDWVGRGIAESLQSDVSHTGATLVLPARANVATDDARETARQNHADLAVTGTYQVVGDQVRVNGNVVDVTNNSSIGGFSATGLRGDLFKIEDALGEQLRRLLPQPVQFADMAEAPVQPPLPAPVTYQQPAGNYEVSALPAPTYYDNSAPATVYVAPDYGGFYPFGFYSGFGYGGGYYQHFNHYGNGYDHHGSSHGFYGRPNPTFHNPIYHGGSAPSIGGGHPGGGGFRGNLGGGFHSAGGLGGGHR